MIYINTKTGASFESPCVVKGGNWREASPPAAPAPAEKRPETPKPGKRGRK